MRHPSSLWAAALLLAVLTLLSPSPVGPLAASAADSAAADARGGSPTAAAAGAGSYVVHQDLLLATGVAVLAESATVSETRAGPPIPRIAAATSRRSVPLAPLTRPPLCRFSGRGLCDRLHSPRRVQITHPAQAWCTCPPGTTRFTCGTTRGGTSPWRSRLSWEVRCRAPRGRGRVRFVARHAGPTMRWGEAFCGPRHPPARLTVVPVGRSAKTLSKQGVGAQGGLSMLCHPGRPRWTPLC